MQPNLLGPGGQGWLARPSWAWFPNAAWCIRSNRGTCRHRPVVRRTERDVDLFGFIRCNGFSRPDPLPVAVKTCDRKECRQFFNVPSIVFCPGTRHPQCFGEERFNPDFTRPSVGHGDGLDWRLPAIGDIAGPVVDLEDVVALGCSDGRLQAGSGHRRWSRLMIKPYQTARAGQSPTNACKTR